MWFEEPLELFSEIEDFYSTDNAFISLSASSKLGLTLGSFLLVRFLIKPSNRFTLGQ